MSTDFDASSLAISILAGGKSSRMGSNKALLEIAGEKLIARTIRLARELTDSVKLVGNPETLGDYGQVIQDRFPNCGPLGGIHAALLSTDRELNLVLAVDLPLMTVRTLRALVARAGQTTSLVTVARFGTRYEAVCAIYRRGFLPLAEAALREHRTKPDALFFPDITTIVGESDLPPGARAEFVNVNTPEDLEFAKSQIEARLPL